MVRRREVILPTWRGWIAILVLLASIGVLAGRYAYSFFAIIQPLPADILVVEGWAPQYALDQAREEFFRGHYRTLFVTGGVIEQGSLMSDYQTYANLGSTMLLRSGFPGESLQSVPAPFVERDRTFSSALALKQWMTAHGGVPPAFNVISLGTHSRRTRLLFQLAFEKQSRVGVIAVRNQDYDPSRWWHSSQGVRAVVDETVAYLYVRLCFKPRGQ